MSDELPGKPPWEGALYEAMRRMEQQLRDCKADRARLQARLVDRERRLELGRERYRVLRNERDQLLRQLGDR